MKSWQILLAPGLLLLVVALQKAQTPSDSNKPLETKPVPIIAMLQPVRIENGRATAEALLTYPDGRAEHCTFEMAVVMGTGGLVEGFMLQPRSQKCMTAT